MTNHLSETQRSLLATACARPGGAMMPIEAGVKGGALRKVLDALATRGLVAGEGEDLRATPMAYEALGLEPSATTAEPGAPRGLRPGAKQALLVGMLRRDEGATIAEIAAATGWQAHTVRGALAGALKKRLGMAITSAKVEGRGRVYRSAP